MVSIRTIIRVLLETAGEFMIIYAAFLLGKSGISWKIGLFILIGIGLRLYADQLTIAVEEGTFWERLFRLTK